MGQSVHPRPRTRSRYHPSVESAANRSGGGFRRRLRDLLHRQRQGHWTERRPRGAVLFDAMGSKRPNLTLEDFSSDHPVILQRVYNFLCCVVGSDPQRLQNPLVTDGYIPQVRAMLCRKEWTQLNYGWWTLLEPYVTDSSKKQTKAARQQAAKDLEDENNVLPAKIRQIRGGQ